VKNIIYVDVVKILRLNINNHPQCPCLIRWKGVIFKKQCFVLYKIQCSNMNSYVILYCWKYEKLFLVNHVFGIDMESNMDNLKWYVSVDGQVYDIPKTTNYLF
jgi:hypothetical protein